MILHWQTTNVYANKCINKYANMYRISTRNIKKL